MQPSSVLASDMACATSMVDACCICSRMDSDSDCNKVPPPPPSLTGARSALTMTSQHSDLTRIAVFGSSAGAMTTIYMSTMDTDGDNPDNAG